MKKRVFSLILAIILTFLTIPIELPTQAADSTYPTWRTPVENEEINSYESYTVTWKAPTSGTVSHYLFSMRKLKEKKDTVDELIYNRVVVNSRTYTVPASMISPSSYYRVAVGVVLTNGTEYWITRNIFSSEHRGVQSGNVISFKFSPELTYDEKMATYYSAQTWKTALGIEVANTYAVSIVPTADYPDINDGENIVCYYSRGGPAVMTTHGRRTTSGTRVGSIIEADIAINLEKNITIGGSSSSYDFQSAMTHEFGHVIGLSDKYETQTAEWTMYGEIKYNETKKRSLENHDIQYAKMLSGVS